MTALLLAARVAAIALPLLVALGLWLFVRRRRRVARLLADPRLVGRVVGRDLGRVPWGRVALVLLASLLLAAALADPRWGEPEAGAEVQGGPVVLVLDVSNSMLAEDVAPSRLAVLRTAARGLVRELGGQPVGIVVFAGRAYALAPPTVDPAAVDLYLDALDPQMVTQTGSALAPAIRQAVGLLANEEGANGSVVLMTDGDTREESREIRSIVAIAARAGIPLHTVGMATPAGAPVPDIDFATGRTLGHKRTETGETAVSRLGEELLQEIAAETGGTYFDLAQARLAGAVAERIRAGAGGGGEGGFAGGAARFAWFAGGALLLLVMEGLLSRARPRREGV